MNANDFVKARYLKIDETGPEENHKWEMELMLPEWLAKWDVFAIWEKERYFSMKQNLKQGDVLFDIGAESGWLSVVYAKLVGPENMVLFEPSGKYWPTIKSIWEHNFSVGPKGTYEGFVGAQNHGTEVQIKKQFFPDSSQGELIESGMPYAYIHNPADNEKIPTITLDSFIESTKVIPTALTIDVEGAEMAVMKGALNLLREHKPKVWMSIHPDLMLKNYGVSKEGLMMWMKKLGYTGELLAVDHEEHYYFTSN